MAGAPSASTPQLAPRQGWQDWDYWNILPTCYNSGKKADRKHAIDAIEKFCHSYPGVLALEGPHQHRSQEMHYGNWRMELEVTVDEGVKQTHSLSMCQRDFRRILDRCNANTENGKQGGELHIHQMTWRLDPQ